MTKFDNFKSKNIDELVEWLDKYGAFDNSPWMLWFDKNYCRNCPPEDSLIPDSQEEQEYWHHCECAWCELHDKCKFFPEMDEVPDNKQVIKMWLESEEELDAQE